MQYRLSEANGGTLIKFHHKAFGLIQEEHRRILGAIESRDPKAAREAMRRHLTRSLQRYRKLAAEQQVAA